ncbi:MAG: hypothetical protein R2750_12570 [Bacteroidales bacterium]
MRTGIKVGPFWDKENKVAQSVYEHSPHKLIDKWDTPILIIHGELDYRVVFTIRMTAFNGAIERGCARYSTSISRMKTIGCYNLKMESSGHVLSLPGSTNG